MRLPDKFNEGRMFSFAVAPQPLVVGVQAVVEPATSARLVEQAAVEAGAAALVSIETAVPVGEVRPAPPVPPRWRRQTLQFGIVARTAHIGSPKK